MAGEKEKKGKTFSSFLVSYVSLLLVPILILSVFLLQTFINNLNNDVKENNLNDLEALSNTFG